MTSVTATPEWLTRREVGLCPCGCAGRRSRTDVVEKTLTGAAGLVREAMFGDELASKPGLLQRVDPRVKLVTLLAMLVTAGLARHVAVLGALYAGALVLAAASRLPLRSFVTRVWLFVPLFTGIVVLPATLNVVTHGTIVVHLGSVFGHRLGITQQGLVAAGLVVARVAVSISFVVLLTLTTPWHRLLQALRALFVPRLFVVILGMTYRYVFHLLTGVTEMYTARKARTVTRDRDATRGRAFVAATGGALFGKAHALSEEVHQAMVARGYTGAHRALAPARLRALDAVWACGCAAALVLAMGADRVLAR